MFQFCVGAEWKRDKNFNGWGWQQKDEISAFTCDQGVVWSKTKANSTVCELTNVYQQFLISKPPLMVSNNLRKVKKILRLIGVGCLVNWIHLWINKEAKTFGISFKVNLIFLENVEETSWTTAKCKRTLSFFFWSFHPSC